MLCRLSRFFSDAALIESINYAGNVSEILSLLENQTDVSDLAFGLRAIARSIKNHQS